MNAQIENISIFRDDEFSEIQDALLSATEQYICFCAGRRVGKSFSGARKLTQWILTDMWSEWEKLQRGDRDRWAGEGLRPTTAKEMDPDVLYWVVAPRTEHLSQIRGNLLTIFAQGAGKVYNHPQFPDWLEDRNRHMWLWLDGICGRIDFIPATGQVGMVSRGLHGAWIDEAGFVPNDRYLAFKPTLWEHCGKLLVSGTPSLGESHFFTKLSASGLDEKHERYDEAVAKRDPRVKTFIASTVEHAYSEDAREEALKDAEFWGPIWAAQWIYADWRQRSLNVFSEWSPGRHVRSIVRPAQRFGNVPVIGRQPYCWIGSDPVYSAPDLTHGAVDWSGGTNPGAAIVANVWSRNPLNVGDTRPLILVEADHEGHEAYTGDGWWAILASLERAWGVERWTGDPHAPRLIKEARRSGIMIEEGAHQDKLGRLSLVAALLHYDDERNIKPALYVSTLCQHLPRELSGYRWQRTRDGRATNKAKQSDDHCIDCLAMLVPEQFAGVPGVAIGGKYFGV